MHCQAKQSYRLDVMLYEILLRAVILENCYCDVVLMMTHTCI